MARLAEKTIGGSRTKITITTIARADEDRVRVTGVGRRDGSTKQFEFEVDWDDRIFASLRAEDIDELLRKKVKAAECIVASLREEDGDERFDAIYTMADRDVLKWRAAYGMLVLPPAY